MADIKIKDFRKGLDTRRSVLETELGALIELENAHINQGGEIEKRKKFLQVAMPDGTFGAQSNGTSIVTFGSDDPAGSITAALAALPAEFSVTYKRLQHPAVVDGLQTYDAAYHDLEEIVHSTVFGNNTIAIARFSDDQVFVYQNTTVMRDFFAGQILSYLASNNIALTQNIVTLINEQGDYAATQLTFAVTGATCPGGGGNVATLTVASTTGLVTGQSIKVTGVGANFNTSLVTLTGVTATQVTYALGHTNAETLGAGGTITSCLIAVVGDAGEEFNVLTTETSVSGSFGTPTTTAENNPGKAGVAAVGSFRLTGGRVGGAASATLTDATNVLPTAGQTVTIGTKVYTYVAAITNTEGEVLIGVTTANAALQNLIDAINHGNNGGSGYYCALPHPDVSAGALNTGTHAFSVVARVGGTGGNSIAKAETSGVLAWDAGGGGTFLSGGTASAGVNTVSSIKVVAPTGVGVELLSSAVEFVTDIPTTAAAIVTAINAYTDTSTYSAVVTDVNTISVYSRTTANPQPNNYDIQVTTNGNVCVGDCYFLFEPTAYTTWSVTQLNVNNINVLGAAISVSALSPSNLSSVYALMETQINAATKVGVAHGVIACAYAGYIQLSQRVSSSNDPIAAVNATVSNGLVTFTDSNPQVPPAVDSVLGVDLSIPSYAITMTALLALGGVNLPTVTAVASGGTGPYTFDWKNAYDYIGSLGETIQANTTHRIYFRLVADPVRIVGAQFIDYLQPTSRFSAYIIPNQAYWDGRTYTFTYRCKVTDSLGASTYSNFFSFLITLV